MRTFEFKDGKSNKFWKIDLSGKAFTVTFGKIGTAGQTQEKKFPSAAAAQAAHDKLVAEKLGKGYVETTGGVKAAPAASSSGKALENAILANPDDLGAHAAYADWLIEQGDPRGEFIQVQLALEDPKKTGRERKELQKRERELLTSHEKNWLGELAPLLLGSPQEQLSLFEKELRPEARNHLQYLPELIQFRHSWARGWLERFECKEMSVAMTRMLCRAPVARLLRALIWRGESASGRYDFTPGADARADRWFYVHEVLKHHALVRGLRIFQYGIEVDPEEDQYDVGTQFDALAPLIEKMPQLEELYIFAHTQSDNMGWADSSRIFSLPTLANLRILQHYHGHAYPLETLAANPALGRLTHLLCFPHSFARAFDVAADDFREGGTAITPAGVQAVVKSPHLQALTHLQLRCCDGGDAMIADIVASGVLKRLRMLDLRHGHVTDEGARLLANSSQSKNLELLDLTNNRLSKKGIAALRSADVHFRADRQQAGPFEDDAVLYFGDSE
jgi:uncharacterized protein (TIGR02996 family)